QFDKTSPVSISSSLTDLTQDTGHTGTSLRRYQTVAVRGQRKPRRHDKRRLSMINGHIYDVDTSIFIPAHGSVTSVTISSLDTAPDVIRRLLAKFRVENSPEDFCLCKVMSTGETRMLQENDHPLMERVISGPLEDNAKIFIMDKDKVDVVTQEMAQFINLPKAMLEAFLQKYRDEEEAAIREINNKYVRHRYLIQKALDELAEGT
ncbi:Ras association domain-containing protein 2, partial [Lamellibrachia satsuma]